MSRDTQVFSVPLDSSGQCTLYWSVDYRSSSLQVEVHFAAVAPAWFALGFSDYGAACPADYCVLWQDWRGRAALQDTWAAADGRLRVDESQDCEDFRHTRSGNVTKFAFRRKFDTCDSNDYLIEVSLCRMWSELPSSRNPVTILACRRTGRCMWCGRRVAGRCSAWTGCRCWLRG